LGGFVAPVETLFGASRTGCAGAALGVRRLRRELALGQHSARRLAGDLADVDGHRSAGF
jgi:hypothetical protein